jgi:hypothetical protein
MFESCRAHRSLPRLGRRFESADHPAVLVVRADEGDLAALWEGDPDLADVSGLDFLVNGQRPLDGERVRSRALVLQINRHLLAGRAHEDRRLEEEVVLGDLDDVLALHIHALGLGLVAGRRYRCLVLVATASRGHAHQREGGQRDRQAPYVEILCSSRTARCPYDELFAFRHLCSHEAKGLAGNQLVILPTTFSP